MTVRPRVPHREEVSLWPFTRRPDDPDVYDAADGSHVLERFRDKGPRGGVRVFWRLYEVRAGRLHFVMESKTLRGVKDRLA